VGGFQGHGDLSRDLESGAHRERPTSDHVGQRFTLDQFEDDGGPAAGLFEAVHRGDVRVIERREKFRLPLEPREPIRIP
jgi:hypothetical protein